MRILVIYCLLLLQFSSWGQAEPGAVKLSFEYEKVPLKDILTDLGERYTLSFSYLENEAALNHKISGQASEVPLVEGLDVLFINSPVKYSIVGSYIVLQWDLEALQKMQLTKGYELKPREVFKPVDPINKKKNSLNIKRSGQQSVPNWQSIELVMPEPPAEPKEKITQISFLPYLGTNAWESDQYTNRLSVNLFWGHNGGVSGTEVGGGGNSVKSEVRGIQVAGFGNIVMGNVRGTQLSLFGMNVDFSNFHGIQFSSLGNYVKKDFAGIQLSLFGNWVSGNISGWQMAGVFNYSGEKVYNQYAGLINWGNEIQDTQLGFLFNKAKRVGGRQLGLINVCDSIRGVPVGLMSWARNGYHFIELGAGEALHLNTAFKTGVKQFYNIFQIGTKINEKTWGLGYGIGTALTLSKRALVNAELIGMHINEGETWTDHLNVLSQIRINVELPMRKNTRFFFGPDYNVTVSKGKDEEGNLIGSEIMPYTFSDKVTGDVNIKMWIGGKVGLRFGY